MTEKVIYIQAVSRGLRLALSTDGRQGRIVTFLDRAGDKCEAREATVCVAQFDVGFVVINLADFEPVSLH